MGCCGVTVMREEDINSIKIKKAKRRVSIIQNIDITKNYEFISILGNGTLGKVRLYRDKNNTIIDEKVKIEPEKFEEYKNSRNFLPKKRRDNNISNVQNEKNPKISLNDSEENKNSSSNFQYPNNIYYYPVNGNMIYYIYNNFYLNFLNIQQAQTGNKKNENIKLKEENKKEKFINKKRNK